MAIRFACPSCRQPIEIDDQWAGQSVGCPFCKKVVTAPSSSTWPPGEVPFASPAGSAFQPPPPPPGYVTPPAPLPPVAARTGSAPWALTLAITAAILSLFAWLIWAGALAAAVQEKVGEKFTEEEFRQAAQEMITSGRVPTHPLATAAAVVGLLCGLGALVLGIRSLLRQETRRGMAIAACLVSVCFVCCQGLLMLITLAGRSPPS